MSASTLDNQFPHRISLSQAAEISGYHQDYLGQLCRLGKIKASKIGRNWYTTKSELESLLRFTGAIEEEQGSFADIMMEDEEDKGLFDFAKSSVAEEELIASSIDSVQSSLKVIIDQDSDIEPAASSETTVAVVSRPVIADNYIISEVSGIPIRLRADGATRQQHTLQTLITRMKLDALRSEVLQLTDFMQGVSDELSEVKKIVAQHEEVLRHRKDLATAYAASIDIAPQRIREQAILSLTDEPAPLQAERTVYWFVPVAAIAVVVIMLGWLASAVMPASISSQQTATIFYSTPTVTDNSAGQVAGEIDD